MIGFVFKTAGCLAPLFTGKVWFGNGLGWLDPGLATCSGHQQQADDLNMWQVVLGHMVSVALRGTWHNDIMANYRFIKKEKKNQIWVYL